MKTLCLHLLTAAAFLAAGTAARADEALLFAGSCRNVTYGVDGLLKVFVLERSDGTLEGYMSISGWLSGSGPLKGTKEGNRYHFSTLDPNWGLAIAWDGSRRNGTLAGEYHCAPNATVGTGKQVGEWSVTLQDASDPAGDLTEQSFEKLFLLRAEAELNAPVKLNHGSVTTGPPALFATVHPVGSGVSVSVTGIDIEWKDGAAKNNAENIRRHTVEYTLYWHGVIQANGHTRLRLTYNNALQAVVAHEVIDSTETTKNDVGDIAFGIGVLLGKAAVDSLLNSK
jgi:hypothetical protein